jgi:hypothetical protein
MKIVSPLFFLAVLASCNTSNPSSNEVVAIHQPQPKADATKADSTKIDAQSKPKFSSDNHPTFAKWVDYYLTLEANISADKFLLENSQQSSFDKGTILATYDKNFESQYKPFLIYSPNKQMYIDFNSSYWGISLDAEGKNEISFEADQDISLINLNQKTVRKISFKGSNTQVEEVYWKNDSIVVLLESNSDKSPAITEININSGYRSAYKYVGTLPKDNSAYLQLKIKAALKI